MEIRYMTPEDDRKAVSRIYEESWRYAYRGIIPQDYLDAIPEGKWIRTLDIPGWDNLICEENGQFIGTGTISRSRWDWYPDAGEVISIYLLPEYIGKGYGRKLMTALTDELEKRGYQEIFLWVLEENSRARAFYEKQGFVRTEDTMEGVIGGKTLREIRYTRRG